jgi:hypothetical protein
MSARARRYIYNKINIEASEGHTSGKQSFGRFKRLVPDMSRQSPSYNPRIDYVAVVVNEV